MQTTVVRASLAKLLAVSALALTSACNMEDVSESTDEGDEDEELGSAEQAFNGWAGSGTRIASNGDYVNWLMGTDVGTTAFLTGVAGNLDGGSARVSPDFGPNFDQYRFHVYSSSGTTLRADAALVSTAAREDGRSFSIPSGVEERRIASDSNPKKRCYLTMISGGPQGQFFNSADDSAAIVHRPELDGWYLRLTGSASAAAYCMTLTTTNFWVANGPGTHDLGELDTGKACWLTGVMGRFRNNANMNDGVYLQTINGKWELVVANGKWGGAECGF